MPHLFSPYAIRGVTFKNRLVVSPMCQYAAHDGIVSDWHFAHHGRLALGGVGGCVVEATGVVPEGRITPGCPGLWDDRQIEGMARIAGIYHAYGATVGIQLAHAGRKASASRPWDGSKPLAVASPAEAWQTVAPSAQPHAEGWPEPRQLSTDDIRGLVEAFAAAARRAVRAGFDFVEIHGAHGYLIHSFLAAVSNRRNDAYGGGLAGRMRFALEVVEAVRTAIPATMPLFYRTSCVDIVENGVTLEDTIELAKALKERGVDVLDCSSGGISGPLVSGARPPAPGHQVPYASAVRSQTGLATMAVGLITTPAQAEAVVAEGHADLVAIGRELLANSEFPFQAAQALGLDEPEAVLPLLYHFYLKRRRTG